MGTKHSDKKKKKYKNYSIHKSISFSNLTIQEKKLISFIPSCKKIYLCKKCGKIPIIEITFLQGEIIFGIICLKHEEYWGYQKFIECLNIKNYSSEYKIKEKDLLPFETKEDLDNYIKAAEIYFKLKDKIIQYNDEIKDNHVFSFFENLLSLGLYGGGTKYEYLNSILFKDMDIFYFNSYNKIKELPNGKKFFLKSNEKIYDINDLYSNSIITKLNSDSILIINKNIIFFVDPTFKNTIIKKIDVSELKIINQIISLQKNIYLIRGDEIKVFIIEINGKNYSINRFNPKEIIEKNQDKIYFINTLKHKAKNFSKNVNSTQFILLAKKYLFLYEYSEYNDYYFLKEFLYIEYSNIDAFDKKPSFLELNNGDIIINKIRNLCCFDVVNWKIRAIINKSKNHLDFFLSKFDKNHFFIYKDYMMNSFKLTYIVNRIEFCKDFIFKIFDNLIFCFYNNSLRIYDFQKNEIVSRIYYDKNVLNILKLNKNEIYIFYLKNLAIYLDKLIFYD